MATDFVVKNISAACIIARFVTFGESTINDIVFVICVTYVFNYIKSFFFDCICSAIVFAYGFKFLKSFAVFILTARFGLINTAAVLGYLVYNILFSNHRVCNMVPTFVRIACGVF